MKTTKFRIIPVSGGYTIQKRNLFGFYQQFKLLDVHPGYGAIIKTKIKGTREDCEKVLRILKLSKIKVKNIIIHWSLLDYLEVHFGIRYTYQKK